MLLFLDCQDYLLGYTRACPGINRIMSDIIVRPPQTPDSGQQEQSIFTFQAYCFVWGENGENGTKSQKQPVLVTLWSKNSLFFIICIYVQVKMGENGVHL